MCLPDVADTQFTSDDIFTVSGWGKNREDEYIDQLYYVQVPWVSDNQCKQAYRRISNQMICAGNWANGGVDACQGDSGGPLTWVDPNSGKVKLVGVVSWGDGWYVIFSQILQESAEKIPAYSPHK